MAKEAEDIRDQDIQDQKAKAFASYSPRERILAAALKLFVEQGYFNTNVPDLSRESKCSVGSIYHTFKNKEEVAASLYKEGLAAFRGALEESLDGLETVEDIIRTVTKSFMEFSQINVQLSKYMWLSRHEEFLDGNIPHPTMVGFDSLGRTLTKAIKSGIRTGKIRPMKANVLWSILFGMPLAYVRDWLEGYNPTPPSEVAEEISAACWRALSADSLPVNSPEKSAIKEQNKKEQLSEKEQSKKEQSKKRVK